MDTMGTRALTFRWPFFVEHTEFSSSGGQRAGDL